MDLNIWGLVAVVIFYLVILILGIIAGRRAKHSERNANSEEVMLAGRNIGKVWCIVTCNSIVCMSLLVVLLNKTLQSDSKGYNYNIIYLKTTKLITQDMYF